MMALALSSARCDPAREKFKVLRVNAAGVFVAQFLVRVLDQANGEIRISTRTADLLQPLEGPPDGKVLGLFRVSVDAQDRLVELRSIRNLIKSTVPIPPALTSTGGKGMPGESNDR